MRDSKHESFRTWKEACAQLRFTAMWIVFFLHLAVTWMLVGLIWTVQIVVYPQFRRVGEPEFPPYHFAHCFRIGLVVGPLLLLEAASAGLLLYLGQRDTWFIVSLVLMGVNWLSTAVLQAPMHTKLALGFNSETVRRLILTNWIRTVAWTVRGLLLAAMAASYCSRHFTSCN